MFAWFPGKTARAEQSAPTLTDMLRDAQQLLIYAAEAGIDVDPAIANPIITASRAENPWADNPGVLLQAVSKLAAKLRPVTASTLEACRKIAKQEIIKYTLVAIVLALFILPLSILSFITTGLCTSINTDLHSANDLAVTLHSELDSSVGAGKPAGENVAAPPSSLSQLQQFAATMRAVKEHAAQLNGFLYIGKLNDPSSTNADDYELPSNLPNVTAALQDQTNRKTALYQDVRRYAGEVEDTIGLYYGAIGTFILPILYALLGACAYLLRLFSKELESGSFSNRYGISARFFIALIGGIVVGLFNNFTGGASLSPLAYAFLAGYAADVFFSFLENLLDSAKKSAASQPAT